MVSEILNVIPKLNKKALEAMERGLQSRFTRVAKKFGKSMSGLFKGASIGGFATILANKFLNPLKEVQEAIDRTLQVGADVQTNATQFGTSAGQLFKLQQLAKSKGIDEQSLYTLIGKFQSSIAEAKLDPSKPSAVRNYTGTTDFAEGFFEFIQALQKMDKTQQIAVQEQVFGEKQVLKMASFLQTDFAEQFRKIGAKDASFYDKALKKLDKLEYLTQVLTARRELGDIITKGRVINSGMIYAKDQADQIALDRENQKISQYQSLKNLENAANALVAKLESGLSLIGSAVPSIVGAINRLNASITKLGNSKFARGIIKWFGGKGD